MMLQEDDSTIWDDIVGKKPARILFAQKMGPDQRSSPILQTKNHLELVGRQCIGDARKNG